MVSLGYFIINTLMFFWEGEWIIKAKENFFKKLKGLRIKLDFFLFFNSISLETKNDASDAPTS